jgi:hypothetical protein
MIGRLAARLRGRGRRVAPAMEERLAALERALGVKLEAQLVVLAQALAEVVTRELARERRQLRLELTVARDGAGQGTGVAGPGAGPATGRAAGSCRVAGGSLLERAAEGPPRVQALGARR